MFGSELVAKLILLSLSCAWDNKIWEKIDQRIRQFAYEISSHYQEDFRNRHGSIKISGAPIDLDIKSIYVPIDCQNVSDRGKEASRDRRKFLKRNLETLSKTQLATENDSLFEQANAHQYLILCGEIGAGKTISLKYIALEALNQDKNYKYIHRKIPVYIDLNNYFYHEKPLFDIITNEFIIADVPDSQNFANETLKKGNLLILIDSIDDLEQKEQVKRLSEIRAFVEKYPDNRYVIARKEAIGNSYLTGFKVAYINSFATENIYLYVQKWFNDQNSKAKQTLLSVIERNDSFPLDYCCNPLLLARICILFAGQDGVPVNITTIHENLLKIVLVEWPREKGDDTSDNWAYLKEELLATLAFSMFQQSEKTTLKVELLENLDVQAQTEHEMPLMFSPSQLLHDFQFKHSIFEETQDGSYQFRFYSMQEYLAGYFLLFKSQYIDGILMSHFLDERWRNVFILSSGIANADKLITSMLEHINFFYLTPRLRELAVWAKSATRKSNSSSKVSAQVAFAIFILFEVIAIYQKECKVQGSLFSLNRKIRELFLLPSSDITSSYSIDPKLINFLDARTLIEISKNMIQRITDLSILNMNQQLNEFHQKLGIIQALEDRGDNGKINREKCIEFIYNCWMRCLIIDIEEFNFSVEDVNSFRNYLYGYELILKCSRHARQISTQVCFNIDHVFMDASEGLQTVSRF